MRIGFRRAGQRQVLSLVMPSPTTPLSVENEVMAGCSRGRRVDGDAQRGRGHPGIAGGIGGRGGQAVGAVRQDRRGDSSRPLFRWRWRCRAASRRHRP